MERIFWSVPLSLAISTIASVLIGKFLSLTAVSVFLLASAALWLAVLCREWVQLRRSRSKWNIGWQPLGNTALVLAIVWIAVAVFSLVDFQKGHQLFMSLTIYDHAPRVGWTESILRTGIPPANPLYWYKSPATLRYYYFWYVLCAAVAHMTHLSVRAVFIASCVWSGFILAAVTGLYLKHFLGCGIRLRRQFLLAVCVLMVTGLDICVNLWDLFYLHMPLPGYLQVWTAGQITSWFNSLLWVPHHVASMVCCMFAFLLAWMAGNDTKGRPVASVVLIAAALASAFGLSIYVAFGFFLVMLVWALWQVVGKRAPRPALLLASGGVGAVVLLLPYLWELTRTSSGMHAGSLFWFTVRETVPPDGLLASRLFQHLVTIHPIAARNLANLILLVPGYAVELGFYFAVMLIYLVPAWRGRTPLTAERRSLLFIAVTTLLIISVVRSGVLDVNDFGFRAALPMQFALLLLGSELISAWRCADGKDSTSAGCVGLPRNNPHWLRSAAAFALIFGFFGTCYQALLVRFTIPLVDAAHASKFHDPVAGSLSHNAYISSVGYAQLNASISRNAIVQPNPASLTEFWRAVDVVGIDHQEAIDNDQPWCGSELGGDPSGCPGIAAAIDSLFNGATAEQARATCRQFRIQYLVASIYDHAWNDKSSWVWTLPAVVSDDEFRALDCRQ